MRAHGRAVYRAGVTLTFPPAELAAGDLAAPLASVCLTGARELVVGGQTHSLVVSSPSGGAVDATFPALPASAGAQGCRVEVGPSGNLVVTILGGEGWTTVNGEYLLDDPENLTDAEQRRNGLNRSRQIFIAAAAVLADDPANTAAAVAAAVQPLCLRAFSSVTVDGRMYAFGAPAVPIGLAACTVEPVGEDDFRVTVTTANGGRYVNGAAR